MEEKQGKLLPFLYETAPGRFLLRGLTHPAISKIAGAFLDTRASTVLIRSYVRKYHIDLSLYEPVQYQSFNQFFTRKIRPENRPFAMGEHDLQAHRLSHHTGRPVHREGSDLHPGQAVA